MPIRHSISADMYWIISYDIADDSNRRRVAKRLETMGTRVQYSVFEVELETQSRLHLMQELLECIDPELDSLRWYPQCHGCQEKSRKIGQGRYLEQGKDYLLF